MAESTGPTPFHRVIETLRRHDVDFIVIGGQAEVIHGGARVTYDIDLAYRRSDENIEQLVGALREMHPRLRGAPPDLPFVLDARSLTLGSNFTFETDHGALDLLGWLEPLGAYEAFEARAEAYEFDGGPLLVMSVDDLIRIKSHINRPKDQASLVELRAIRAERERMDREGDNLA